MNNICPYCFKPVLKGEALNKAMQMEQKQGVSRNWWHIKCLEGKESMKTYEEIMAEVLEEVINPDNSSPATLDTRSLLVRTAALAITVIEGLDNKAETEESLINGAIE
jgi:hypothetical protein